MNYTFGIEYYCCANVIPEQTAAMPNFYTVFSRVSACEYWLHSDDVNQTHNDREKGDCLGCVSGSPSRIVIYHTVTHQLNVFV